MGNFLLFISSLFYYKSINCSIIEKIATSTILKYHWLLLEFFNPLA